MLAVLLQCLQEFLEILSLKIKRVALTYLLTYSMEQCPACEANRFLKILIHE